MKGFYDAASHWLNILEFKAERETVKEIITITELYSFEETFSKHLKSQTVDFMQGTWNGLKSSLISILKNTEANFTG